MNKKSGWDKFTNLYSLQKTLRFELKPVGKTLENIEKKGLITQDEKRAESYKMMKKTIDRFHKHFIEIAMSQVKLTKLNEFAELYNAPPKHKKEKSFKETFEKVQADLRKEVVKSFKTSETQYVFPKLFKKELITKLLEEWISKSNKKIIKDLDEWNKKSKAEKNYFVFFDKDFKKFTTYFQGFHENRKNMYTDKAQSTAIAYRLIHENLPKFLDNISTFKKLKAVPELYGKCTPLHNELKENLGLSSIDEAFDLEYYNKTLSQKQIDTYNLIISGKATQEGKKKIQGLNEYINLYNQKHGKKDKIPKLKQLYKQILSDRESVSFLPDAFEDDAEETAGQKVLNAIEEYYQSNIVNFRPGDKDDPENVLEKIKELLENLKSYDLEKVYIRNDKAITDISKTLFGDWGVIKAALEFSFLQTLEIDKKGLSKKQEMEKEKYLEQPYFSIAEIEKALGSYKNKADLLKDLEEDANPVADYFHTHFLAKKKEESDKEFDLIANIRAKYSCIKGILNTKYPKEKQLHQDKKTIGDIKAFLDSLMEMQHFVKPLSLPADSPLERDEIFYSQFQPWFDQLQLLIPLYNKVRNYATQKPYSIEKFKLNFENSTFLAGWDVNKEKDNLAIILEKEGDYFLGVMDKKHNKIFREIPAPKSIDVFKKVNYKLIPDPKKMLPKVFFSDKNIDFYAPSSEILKIRKHSSHTKNGSPQKSFEKSEFKVSDCHKMISFFKKSLQKHPEWNCFGFRFSPTKTYGAIDEFYRELKNQSYSISYIPFDKNLLMEYIDQGKLYLFQIWNKDFSKHSKGKPNLHTIYWKALFDPKNLKNVMYQLNGEAEMFYRKKSIKNPKIHKANEPIKNKNPNNPKKESVFGYDLVKDRRYTVDKFQFHVPITLNFKATGTGRINDTVLRFIKNNPEVNIIGLDRGERHLIYLTLIDQKGNILKQQSLNIATRKIPASKKFNIETNYHELLDNKEKERDKSRKDWRVVENIKELKEGYISQIVYDISKMMVKHNAIVVMEDLNFGFKRGRFKVEKQIYQKLEKKLIDKLNYLVFKDKAENEIGGLYCALQLTNKFESFKKLGKQSGFLFYVPAWHTSKIDPTSGFVNLFNTRYESADKAKRFFNNFENIRYNKDRDYFEFEVKEYSKFNPKADGTRQEWVICTNGDRIKTSRNPSKNNQWNNEKIVLSDEFKNLFKKYKIEYEKDLKNSILSQTEKTFFEKLLNLFKYTVQMRNSVTGSEVDYIISPVMNAKGEFYDSRKAGGDLPKDADANGAYQIAKKGAWVLNQIKAHEGKDWKKLNLAISNKEWLQFAQAGEGSIYGKIQNN